MEKSEYSIAVDMIEEVIKKLSALKRKADKYNCNLSWAFGETEKPFTVTIRDKYDNIINKYTTLSRILTLESEIITNGNYELWAKLDHNSDNNIVTTFNNHEIDQNWFTFKPNCDCCHTNHQRSVTYIIRNITDNKFLQVGSSCLHDYTGIYPDMAIAFLALWTELYDFSTGYYDESFPPSKFFEVRIAIAIAVKSINKNGYIKAEYQNSTKNQILDTDYNDVSNDDLLKSDEIITWLKSNEFSDDFLINCKNIASQNFVKNQYLGFLAYLPVAFQKWNEKQTEENKKQEERKISNYVGKIGEKIQFEIKEWKLVSSFETMYGTSFVYRFIDYQGNVYTWFTSSRPENEEYTDHEKNRQLIRTRDLKSIKGTIKDQNEYKGEKQTVITRCKVSYTEL
jgi:hypothetical protein